MDMKVSSLGYSSQTLMNSNPQNEIVSCILWRLGENGTLENSRARECMRRKGYYELF